MRVLTFLHSFEPGGVERIALRLVRRWRELGVDAPLFMGRAEGELESELAGGLAFTTPPSRFSTAWFETFWMIIKLPGFIRRTEPDVLFCAGNTYTIVAVAMKLLLRGRCPRIVAKVSNDLVRPGTSRLVRWFYTCWAWIQSRFIDAWVVMHPAMYDEVRELAGSTSASIIPDPALTREQIPILRRWHPSPRRDKRRFAAAGRLVPQKNYPLMIRAFASGSGLDDELTIYGGGPQLAKLRRLVRSLGMQRRVHFAGHVHDAAAQLLLEDVLVLSSVYEGIPAILVEAMTCGMPIVSTRCGPGVIELLATYSNGTVVERGDVEGFSLAIARHSSSQVSPQASAFDPGPFTIEAGSREYLDLFMDVAGIPSSTVRPSIMGPQARPSTLAPLRSIETLASFEHRVSKDRN